MAVVEAFRGSVRGLQDISGEDHSGEGDVHEDKLEEFMEIKETDGFQFNSFVTVHACLGQVAYVATWVVPTLNKVDRVDSDSTDFFIHGMGFLFPHE